MTLVRPDRRTGMLATAAFLLSAAPAFCAGLNAPFASTPPIISGEIPTLSCDDPAPEPVLSLSVASIYDQNDPSRSNIDPDQFDDYSADMSDIRDYLTDVTKYASDYVASSGKRVKSGLCALAWLDAWTRGGALSQLETRQSALSVTRVVAGMAIAYLAVRPLADAVGYDAAPLETWFRARSDSFITTFSGDNRLGSNRSNHRYWGGFAVAASGVVTGDPAKLDWGVESFRLGACQVTADGALPLELARKKRARDYHLHAIAPLVMIAELAAANGRDAYDLCDGAIHRLIAFVLASVTQPAAIEKLAGAKVLAIPTKDGHLRGDRFAWVEPYFKRFGGNETAYGFSLERPLFSSNLGGRLTTYFDAGQD